MIVEKQEDCIFAGAALGPVVVDFDFVCYSVLAKAAGRIHSFATACFAVHLHCCSDFDSG
jgi:hypothetical protein